jgi:TPR repeat protein
MYQYGWGVPQNFKEALKWHTRAAEQGHVTAQIILGGMYKYGWGVPKNATEAVKWDTKAAEQGDAGAQFSLGDMYAKGEGVPQNYEQAYIWLSLAAAQPDAPEYAAKLRDEVAKKLPPKDLIAAQQRASELQKQIEANAKTP